MHFNVIPLAASQNSALERFDSIVADELASSRSSRELRVEQMENNDNAINACSFICVTLGHLLLSDSEYIMATVSATQAKIVEVAERSIRDFPRYFNAYRNPEQRYDAQEAYNILQTVGIVNEYDLTEESISSSCVYSKNGKRSSRTQWKRCKGKGAKHFPSICGYLFIRVVYMCFWSVMWKRRFSLSTVIPWLKILKGQQTAVAIFSDGHETQCSFLCDWLSTRLKKSGVAEGSIVFCHSEVSLISLFCFYCLCFFIWSCIISGVMGHSTLVTSDLYPG